MKPDGTAERGSPFAEFLRAQVHRISARFQAAAGSPDSVPDKAALHRFLVALDELSAATDAVGAGTQTAPRRIKPGWALDLCITGRWIDAHQALFVGLVAKVVARGNLNREADRMARRLGRQSRELVAAAKLAVWEGLNTSLRDGLELEHRLGRRIEHFRADEESGAVLRR